MHSLRRAGWLACLVLVVVLAASASGSALDTFRQALGVRGLLQAEAVLPNNELKNPFLCLRSGADTILAREAAGKFTDEYLQGIALCLAGDPSAGLTTLQQADGQSNARVQSAVGLSRIDPQAAATALAGIGLTNGDLLRVINKVSNEPDIDLRPMLRLLSQQAKEQADTWILWMQVTTRLELANEWQAALDWLEEGLKIAPQEVIGSFYLGVGWILQTQPELNDYRASLNFYTQALEKGGWIYPEQEASTYIFRGEIYRALKDEFGIEKAIEDFKSALKLQPDSYMALIDLGSVYQIDLKDLDQAENYYRKALLANNQPPEAYLYIGDIYLTRNDINSATDWYQKALERVPDYQPALDRLDALEGK